MLFNSLEYAVFLPIVFLLYWVIGYARINDSLKLRMQNAFVVVASYIFYGWWDWRFLLLIAFTSLCSYGSGILMQRVERQCATELTGRTIDLQLVAKKKKLITASNIVLNILILAVFKYYDFFVSEFAQLFNISTDGLLLKVILPIGISFYTFQALSYSIDVYRGNIKPTKDIIAFFAFISFFPQLVAGPIERATNLLPQFLRNRRFNCEQGMDGISQILWGLFKKIVIADNCAIYVDQVWSTYPTQSGSTMLLAAVLFTFQIYGDFSGYSDIAIGTAKLFGIKLMRNFNNPYFSRDIAEFWRRWHISLTTWFRDYVYIPLGGSRPAVDNRWIGKKWTENSKKLIILRNTFIIFLVSGIWHGANWTFLVWGTYHAILFTPLILIGKNRKYTNQVADGRWVPTVKEALQMLLTFALVVIGWVIFRAETIGKAWEYLCGMIQVDTLCAVYQFFIRHGIRTTTWLCLVMLVVEWFQRDKQHGLEMGALHPAVRILICVLLVEGIIFFLPATPSQFIYFQF